MKNRKTTYKAAQSPTKGERLHWTPLKEVQHVTLSHELTTGRRVDAAELSKRNNSFSPNTILVP